jgi:Family of unknown function (DUF5752)
MRHPVNPLGPNEHECIKPLGTLNASNAFNSIHSVRKLRPQMAPITDQRAKQAFTPFEFKSAAHLLFIEKERATNIDELLPALQTCPEESIFQHTFRTLEEHHFIKEGFSNDFAHWAYSELREVGLGERLASLDVREFTSLAALRNRLVEIVEDFSAECPKARSRMASSPFYFCSSKTIILPPQQSASNLEQFVDGLKKVSLHSIHYHFIEARLRRKLESNDFSIWLLRDLGLEREADLLNRIDIYTSTLEGVRRKIIQILQNPVN